MAIRVRTRRHREGERSLEEIAGTLGFIIWRIGANSLLELENAGFVTYSNAHRLEIMAEFLAFLLQSADRLIYEKKLPDAGRQAVVNGIGLHLTRTYTENRQDLFGPGDYEADFITHLNRRTEEYAERAFSNGEAGLDFLRHLGELAANILGEKNRHWAAQHIIELEGPQAIKTLRKAINDIFDEKH